MELAGRLATSSARPREGAEPQIQHHALHVVEQRRAAPRFDAVREEVGAAEARDEEGYYEVEVTKDDGSQVDLHLDNNFNILSTPADHEGPESKDAPDDGADSGE